MTIFYSSNDATTGFDALATGSLPTGWVAKSGTWQLGTTLPTPGHTHSFGSTTRADGDVALLTGIAAAADMELLFSQTLAWSGGHSPALGAVLRADSVNANNYTIVMTGGGASASYYLFRKVGGSYSIITAGAAVGGASGVTGFAAGDTMWLRARVQGSTISVRAWKNGAAEPAGWDVSAIDTSVSAAGYGGLYFALDAGAAVSMAVGELQALSVGGASLTVSTPGTTAAGAALTVSGTYAGGVPVALDCQIDGGTWTASAAPTIGGGTWSFSITAPAAGVHTIGVRDHTTLVSATSGSFTTTGGRSIAVTTPAGWAAGSTVTLGGTYGGTAPAGLNYQVDATGYAAAPSPTIGGGAWSFSLVAPAAGTHSITVQESDSTATTATSGTFSTANAIAGDNPAIVYSPYTWNIGAGKAITNNAGAYLRLMFTGTSCALVFDVAAMAAPASQIWWRIDNSAWTQATLAATVTLAIPSATLSNADVPYHFLEVVVKSTTETANRWNAGTSTRVILTGIRLDAGAVLLAPGKAPLNLLIYGDSITEGVRTLGESAASDTDRNDAMMGWAYRLGALLGAETGIVGFGAQGLAGGGSGNVPALGSSWNLLYAGVARSFTPAPDLVVINIGTNDGGANTVAAMTGLLDNLIAACPGKPIAVLRPFNGSQAANLQAAIAACAAPGQCHSIDTTGLFVPGTGADSLNLHPSGPNNLARIAPPLAASLRTLLAGTAVPWFRPGFGKGGV